MTNKNTRGMGRVFRRGRVAWIAFSHHGREIRESSESESEAVARRLLKRRLAESQTGRLVADEGRIGFEDLALGLVEDYKLNERRSLKSAALNNVSHLRAFFGFDRAVDISSDRIVKYHCAGASKARAWPRSTGKPPCCAECSRSRLRPAN